MFEYRFGSAAAIVRRPLGRQVGRLLWLVAMAVACLSLPAALGAQGGEIPPHVIEAERAIGQLRSPYCPGFMLKVCTSSQAAALRDSIYDLAADGASANEMVEWMIGRHGEEWRAVPQRSGAGIWAWLMPPLALLVGAGAVVGWLRASRRPEESASAALPLVTDDERERLAAAMREWEASGEEEDL